MRAATYTAGEPALAIADVADPTPAPGGLVLRVDACGICGSDLHMAHNRHARRGTVFGHEFSGTVVGVGRDVRDLREGDRVVGLPLAGCGTCAACAEGLPSRCARALLTGAQTPGAYAELVALAERDAYRLPDELSADLGALVEPLAVARHALELTPREPGEPVLVLGGGPVGLAVALWAGSLGARQVVVTDPVAHRRALAEAIGAISLDPDAADVGTAFADIAGAPPRAIVECIGRPGAVEHATTVAAPGAHVTFAGACAVPDTFRPITATMKELTLHFAVYYRRSDFTHTIDALVARELDPSPLVTAHVNLDQLPDRFEALLGTNDDCKVLVTP